MIEVIKTLFESLPILLSERNKKYEANIKKTNAANAGNIAS